MKKTNWNKKVKMVTIVSGTAEKIEKVLESSYPMTIADWMRVLSHAEYHPMYRDGKFETNLALN